jgi:hypothetical protein
MCSVCNLAEIWKGLDECGRDCGSKQLPSEADEWKITIEVTALYIYIYIYISVELSGDILLQKDTLTW